MAVTQQRETSALGEQSVNVGNLIKDLNIKSDSHYSNFTTKFLAGGLAGFSTQLIVHPMDTMKTLAQNGQRIHFNSKFLYRGLTAGLTKLVLRGALQQPTVGLWSTLLLSENDKINGKAVLPMRKVALASTLTGITLTPMSQICELLKIQLQSRRSKNLTDLLCWFRQKPSTLWRGTSLTLTRNAIGCTTYFYIYDKTNRFFVPNACIGTNRIDSFESFSRVFFAGASAGLITWAVQLPLDVMKTCVQAEDLRKPSTGIRVIARNVWNQNGITGFYRGAAPTFARSILFNGVYMSFLEFYSNVCK